jgi:hypothetical protein
MVGGDLFRVEFEENTFSILLISDMLFELVVDSFA